MGKEKRSLSIARYRLFSTIYASPFRGRSKYHPAKGVFYFLDLGYCNDMTHLSKKISLKVFLCHSHSDSKAVHILWLRLKKSGVDAWLDIENLQPGQNWQNEIRRAILESDVVIVCLSHEFNNQQGYRHEELKLALEKANFLPDDKIFIIPVRLEKCDMPESLRHLHRVDLFKAGGYKKLVRALRKTIQRYTSQRD